MYYIYIKNDIDFFKNCNGKILLIELNTCNVEKIKVKLLIT